MVGKEERMDILKVENGFRKELIETTIPTKRTFGRDCLYVKRV